jgi:hypothetical protein
LLKFQLLISAVAGSQYPTPALQRGLCPPEVAILLWGQIFSFYVVSHRGFGGTTLKFTQVILFLV